MDEIEQEREIVESPEHEETSEFHRSKPMRFAALELCGVGPFEHERIEFPKTPDGKAEVHIFTGINGCGKSTLLYALAGFFLPQSLAKRFWMQNENSFIEYLFDDSQKGWYDRLWGNCVLMRSDKKQTWYPFNKVTRNPVVYGDYFSTFRHVGGKFSTAIFAYSGSRTSAITSVESLHSVYQELNATNLVEALDFTVPPNSLRLGQWLRNKKVEAAHAHIDREYDREVQIQRSIDFIEEAIEQIIGSRVHFTYNTKSGAVKVIMHDKELEFDVLPDGLKSIIAWLAELVMQLDGVNWTEEKPLAERDFILLLDEIEIHLHPLWQRKILPMLQNLFVNAQIFIATHSPFVVNSVHDAWVYKLGVVDGKAKLLGCVPSKAGSSYLSVGEEIFDIPSYFDEQTEAEYAQFRVLRDRLLQNDTAAEAPFRELAGKLTNYGAEMRNLVMGEVRQLERLKGRAYL
ncbi:MAG: AAA family ATPase [Candidatus Kapaibacteriota bacterium]